MEIQDILKAAPGVAEGWEDAIALAYAKVSANRFCVFLAKQLDGLGDGLLTPNGKYVKFDNAYLTKQEYAKLIEAMKAQGPYEGWPSLLDGVTVGKLPMRGEGRNYWEDAIIFACGQDRNREGLPMLLVKPVDEHSVNRYTDHTGKEVTFILTKIHTGAQFEIYNALLDSTREDEWLLPTREGAETLAGMYHINKIWSCEVVAVSKLLQLHHFTGRMVAVRDQKSDRCIVVTIISDVPNIKVNASCAKVEHGCNEMPHLEAKPHVTPTTEAGWQAIIRHANETFAIEQEES